MRRYLRSEYTPRPQISDIQVVTRNFSQFFGGLGRYDLAFGTAQKCQVVTQNPAHFRQKLRVTTSQVQIRALRVYPDLIPGCSAFLGGSHCAV